MYQCPSCKSHKVRMTSEHALCLSCGHEEPLIDYSVSWEQYRYYADHDPGPDVAPTRVIEHPVVSPLRPEREYLEPIRRELLIMQKQLNKHIDLSKKETTQRGKY